MSIKYTKIGLREFRHTFTQLKDSFSHGVIFEVVEKGKSIGLFVPSIYYIQVKSKKREEEMKILRNIREYIRKRKS